MLTLVRASGCTTTLPVLPAARAVVSWTTAAVRDTLELIVDSADGRRSLALPYVAFEAGRRASLNGFDTIATIETDIVSAAHQIHAITLQSQQPVRTVAVTTPPAAALRTAAPAADAIRELAVPLQTQYLAGHPGERGWCAPASLAMLLRAHGIDVLLGDVVRGVFDGSYNGTGNWTFNIAYAGTHGLTGAVAYLAGLANVEACIAAGLPLALSIAWSESALPGAPLPHSSGHVLVVRGFDARGDVIVNDPAQPAVRHVYERAAFARAWLDHGGVALLVAPAERSDDLVRCANA